MRITARDIENLIEEAKEAGVNPAELEDFKEHLLEIKSGKLMSNSNATFSYEVNASDGRRVIQISTAPILPEDDDDFEGVNFKPIKRGVPPKE